MKKFKKSVDKTTSKIRKSHAEYKNPINQLIKQNKAEEEFIYELNPLQSRSIIINADKIENAINKEGKRKKSSKRKNKSIDIAKKGIDNTKNDFFDSQSGPSGQKKPKKKIIKKRKKSKSKDNTETENEKNKNRNKTPTPVANLITDIKEEINEINNFYLIDYQSKEIKNKEKTSSQTTDKSDENYQTPNEDDYKQKLSINVNDNYEKVIINNNNIHKSNSPHKKKNKSSTNISKIKESEKTIIKSNKMKKIIKRKDKSNYIKMDSSCEKDKEKEKEKEKEKFKTIDNNVFDKDIDISIKSSTEKTDKEKEKDKDKDKEKEAVKKKKKILIKKKTNAKAIIIQSFWRRYKMMKLIKIYKKIKKLSTMFNTLLNKKLKSHLLILFDLINQINNNFTTINNQKTKKKKIKIKNIYKNMKNSFSERSIEKKCDINNKEIKKIENCKKILISPINNDNNNNNNKGSSNYDVIDSNVNCFLIKDYTKINMDKNKEKEKPMNNNNNNKNNNITKVDDTIDTMDTIKQDSEEMAQKSIKTKYKLKPFKIEKENVKHNSSFSLDSINISPKKMQVKTNMISPNIKKITDKQINNSASLQNMAIPLINNINIKNDIKIPFCRFTKESLVKCSNGEIFFINNNQKKKQFNYCKKIIGDNTLNKNKKTKNDYSIIKYLINMKHIVSKIIQKNYFYKILGFLKNNALLHNLATTFINKEKNIMKNALNKYRIKTQLLKNLEQIKKKELIKKNNNKEIKFNKSKLLISKTNANLIFNEKCKGKNNNNEYKKFNNEKLAISKAISNIKINNKKNKKKKSLFKINKIVNEFTIKSSNNKQQKLIITKVIDSSPIINKNKFPLNNNLVMTKKTNNFTMKGIIKKVNNIINRVNSSYIIDDINKYNDSNKKNYYKSLIINNMNNLIINKNININYNTHKNNNSYIFNDKKLVITKVSNNFILKSNKTSLSKIKSIILNHTRKQVYSKIISTMKQYSLYHHISKFIDKKMNLLKILFINNLRNVILEKKYNQNKNDSLIINKVFIYSILNNNTKKCTNQIQQHHIIHKITNNNSNENFIMNDYEKKYLEKFLQKKNNDYIKGNVITKKIIIYFNDNNKINKSKNKEDNNKTVQIMNEVVPKEKKDENKDLGIGENKSKNIFVLYKKYINYSFYMKKILRKWKKIIKNKKNEDKNKKSDEDEENNDNEEGEEFEDEEEEAEEENETN